MRRPWCSRKSAGSRYGPGASAGLRRPRTSAAWRPRCTPPSRPEATDIRACQTEQGARSFKSRAPPTVAVFSAFLHAGRPHTMWWRKERLWIGQVHRIRAGVSANGNGNCVRYQALLLHDASRNPNLGRALRGAAAADVAQTGRAAQAEVGCSWSRAEARTCDGDRHHRSKGARALRNAVG